MVRFKVRFSSNITFRNRLVTRVNLKSRFIVHSFSITFGAILFQIGNNKWSLFNIFKRNIIILRITIFLFSRKGWTFHIIHTYIYIYILGLLTKVPLKLKVHSPTEKTAYAPVKTSKQSALSVLLRLMETVSCLCEPKGFDVLNKL